MLKFVSIFLLIKLFISTAQSCSDKFQASKIIPDIIDELNAEKVLNVTFLQPIECGVQLTPNEVRMMPDVDWSAENDEYYTLLMTDCGAHDDGMKIMEVNHWLVVNIPGNEVNKGETVVEFVGAMPPKGTSIHRYVFLLFKQMGKVNNDETFVSQKTIDGRMTSTRKLINKYNLQAVGGIFFLAEFDDFVPII